MSRLDDLSPDQQATLSLLLRRHKSYAEVAALLSIQEGAVHDRAHAALAVLAPRQARELSAEHRLQVGDYLLGQQAGERERSDTREYLERSNQALAWANAIAEELSPLAGAQLPPLPDKRAPRADEPARAPAATPAAPIAPLPGSTPIPLSEPPDPSLSPSRAGAPFASVPVSRRGGALLLAAMAAIVAVAVILITSSGGGSSGHKTNSTRAGSTTSSSSGARSSTSGRAKEDRRITLTPSEPSSKAIGVAEVLSEGSKYAFYLAAEHLTPTKGFFYAVWLYNSPTSAEPLGKSPPVGSDGRLQGGALLPANAGRFHRMLLTRETSEHPSHPGPIVLSGAFGLH